MVRVPLSAVQFGFAAAPAFPARGCWRLTLSEGATSVSVVAKVVAAQAGRCDASPIGDDSLAQARPGTAGIAGGWTWRTPAGDTLIYAHGQGPGGLNAKVPWWIRRKWGQTLELTGIRLDADGRFRQEFGIAGNPSSRPDGYGAVFPSIVDVPAAGCWLFRLLSASLAGVLVVRAIDR